MEKGEGKGITFKNYSTTTTLFLHFLDKHAPDLDCLAHLPEDSPEGLSPSPELLPVQEEGKPHLGGEWSEGGMQGSHERQCLDKSQGRETHLVRRVPTPGQEGNEQGELQRVS